MERLSRYRPKYFVPFFLATYLISGYVSYTLMLPGLFTRVNGVMPLTITTLVDLGEINRSHGSPVLWVYREPSGRPLLSKSVRLVRRILLYEPGDKTDFLFFILKTAYAVQTIVYNASLARQSPSADCYERLPNPDIVGSGVRCSIYLSLLFVFVSLFVATFHTQQSGTKELGCTVLISEHSPVSEHIMHRLTCQSLVDLCATSLSLAMVSPSDFTPTDYLAVVLMLDAQCVALSATLSSKDALASRWYVGFTLLGQSLAWAVVAYANHKLANSISPSADKCLSEIWMMSRMSASEIDLPLMSFKVYWYIHAVDLIYSGWLALRHTVHFDELEKIDRAQRRGPYGVFAGPETGFDSLRATPFSNWLVFTFHPIALIVALEFHMKNVETSTWGDWGQMMPLTMLVLGGGHWLYLNLKQLYEYINDDSPATESKLFIPWDASRNIAMGAGPSETGEVIHRLLTAKRS